MNPLDTLSIKERKEKWVLSRPNNKNDGFRIPIHDPLNPYISKLRLRPEPNLLAMSEHLIVRKHPISEDQDGFLPPSKKRKPFLNSINMSTPYSAKCKFTWYDDGSGTIPDTYSHDKFIADLASANSHFEIIRKPFNARVPNYKPSLASVCQPHIGNGTLAKNSFDPLRALRTETSNSHVRLTIQEPTTKRTKAYSPVPTPLTVITSIPHSPIWMEL